MLLNSIGMMKNNNKFVDCFEGNFVFLSSSPVSKYDGFFVKFDDSWFRTISFMDNLNKCICLKKGFFCSAKKSDVFLDCRKIFDFREWGRFYNIFTEDDCLVVKFKKVNEIKEDFDDEFELYLAFHGDFSFLPVNSWVEHKYVFDKGRSSFPDSRFVFYLGKIDGDFSFCVSSDKGSAVRNSKFIFENSKKLLMKRENFLSEFSKKIKAPSRFKEAALHAAKSVLSMNYDDSFLVGIPWFPHSWARDELISCKSLFLLGNKDTAIKILFKWLDKIDGLSLKTPRGIMDDSWWAFVRANEFLSGLNDSQLSKLKKVLRSCLSQIEFIEGCIINKHSSWMDSLERDGALEINSLVLAGCKLADKLGIKNFHEELKKNVRAAFLKEGMLKDCFDDPLIRPNVFIAYYVYPELLSEEEWEIVFDSALKHLWLSWGGFSTIDKNSPLFHGSHTGEISDSYHNGDSWFWINELAAICLLRLNKKKYSKYVEKISKAGSKEILKLGAIGHHAELSDADKLSSKGCLSQAWSNALFTELMFELDKKNKKS